MISKFFTAFTDMGTGIMLDSRRKIGPKGKFRPFILYASFPVTLLAIANFVGTPFDVTGKTVMVLFCLCFTDCFQHDELLLRRNGSRYHQKPQRTRLTGGMASGRRYAGLLLCTVGFVPVMNLIEGNQQLGYIFAATLFSLFGLLFMWICYSGVKSVMSKPNQPIRRKSTACCNLSAQLPVTAHCSFCVLPTSAP
ncbi:MFS transporter [Escherichia coli]|uniref:MFS transporter n=1 Tax=Escherichia coli TaxID=562 RepID=UPI0031338944